MISKDGGAVDEEDNGNEDEEGDNDNDVMLMTTMMRMMHFARITNVQLQ